eukprot:1832717-Rhodomonas_salina.1
MPLNGNELGARGKFWDDKKHKIAEETWFTIIFCIEDDPEHKGRIERVQARCQTLNVTRKKLFNYCTSLLVESERDLDVNEGGRNSRAKFKNWSEDGWPSKRVRIFELSGMPETGVGEEFWIQTVMSAKSEIVQLFGIMTSVVENGSSGSAGD